MIWAKINILKIPKKKSRKILISVLILRSAMVNGIDTKQKKIMVIAKVALKLKSLKN